MFDFFRKHQSTLGEYFRSEIRPFRFPASIDNITVEEVSSLLRQVNQILREIQNDRFFRFTPISNLMVLYYNLLGKKKLPILKVFSSAADEELERIEGLTGCKKLQEKLLINFAKD